MDLAHKVFAYITHGTRLLVFDHVDFPDDLPQVPAGTRPTGEDPVVAVQREAFEETGLEGLRVEAFLGEIDFEQPGSQIIARRRFYHLTYSGPVKERWQHYERAPSDGTPDPILFELYWVDVTRGAPMLAPGHDAFLNELRRRLPSA